MNFEPIYLDAHFSFIREKGPIIVAVSGGSDSMALLFLANAWAKKNGRQIHAVTVDHGIRAEAAAEAAYVAMVCDGLNIIHTTLAWDEIKPATGMSEAARKARYSLIAEFAADIGVRIILTGHTSDDQAETVLMRLRRGSNLAQSSTRGHSGMCRRVLMGAQENSVFLLRPLLRLSRQQLRHYLNGISQSWIEDPSNHDESYERVRVRAELERDNGRKERLLQYSDLMGRMREEISKQSANFLKEHCNLLTGHKFSLRCDGLVRQPLVIQQLAIKTIIATAGGGQYLVADRMLDNVLLLSNQNKNGRLTLGNCIVEIKNGRVNIHREVRNIKPKLIASGEFHLWDGRLHVTNDSPQEIQIEVLTPTFIATRRKTQADNIDPFNGVSHSLLRSSPMITLTNGIQIPLFLDRSQLPEQIEFKLGALALEGYCAQWDFYLLDWLKSIDLISRQFVKNPVVRRIKPTT